jgi:hypothetical protein
MRDWVWHLIRAGFLMVTWLAMFSLIGLLAERRPLITEFEWGAVTGMVAYALIQAFHAAVALPPKPPLPATPRKDTTRHAV